MAVSTPYLCPYVFPATHCGLASVRIGLTPRLKFVYSKSSPFLVFTIYSVQMCIVIECVSIF